MTVREDERRPRPGPGRPRPYGTRPSPGPSLAPSPVAEVEPAGPSRRAVLWVGTVGTVAAVALFDRRLVMPLARPSRPAEVGHAAVGLAAPPARIDAHAVSRGTAHRHQHPIRRLDDLAGAGSSVLFAPRAIMLTLDDGPHPVWTPRMLTLLERTGVTATFFMIGSQVRQDPGLVREVAARGHVIGNHTWSHDESLGLRPVARIRSEIERTNHAIHAACGVVPVLFRAPGGNWRRPLLDVLAEQQLLPVGWSVDPRDWTRPGAGAITRTLLRTRPHDIVLCHDGGGDRGQTHRALAQAIPGLQHRGSSFVTLPVGPASSPAGQ